MRYLKLGIVCGTLLLGAPSAFAQGAKEAEGQSLGNMIGGILGNIIPGGSSVGGQIARTLAPTIGGVIGGSIGAQLDAEDRQALEQATRRAISNGSRQTFRGKTGTKGTVTVTANSKNDKGQPCRTVKQEVEKKDGTVLSDTVSACKGDSGWKV